MDTFGLKRKMTGKIVKPFSLLRRGRSKSSRQVSWLRLGPTRRAFPSFDRTQDSGLVAAFVAITVAGPRRIFTGLPLNRGASNYGPDNYTLAGGVSRICWLFFLALRHMISQNTIEMVTIHMNVLRTTMEAASSGSCDISWVRAITKTQTT